MPHEDPASPGQPPVPYRGPAPKPEREPFGSSELPRRALLTAAAVITGVGVIDLFRPGSHAAAKTGGAADRAGGSAPIRHLLEPRVNPHLPTGVAESVGPTATPLHTPTIGTTPPGRHAHHPTRRHDEAHHSKHGAHHAAGHGHDTDHHGGKHAAHGRHHPKVENVDLPGARLQVKDRPAYYLDQIVHDPAKHTIGLTIDDGPDPEWTPKVLRLLDKYRMQATFCVVGVHVVAYPKLVRDIAAAGHAIVNHSYTHIMPFSSQTEKRIVWEIRNNQRAIEKVAKVTPQLFRSPGGDWSHFVYRALASYDLLPLEWDIDPRDWARPGRRRIQHRMLKARPNDIVLCHDGGGNRAETVRALRRVLPAWRRDGYGTEPLVVVEHAWQRQQLTHRLPSKPHSH